MKDQCIFDNYQCECLSIVSSSSDASDEEKTSLQHAFESVDTSCLERGCCSMVSVLFAVMLWRFAASTTTSVLSLARGLRRWAWMNRQHPSTFYTMLSRCFGWQHALTAAVDARDWPTLQTLCGVRMTDHLTRLRDIFEDSSFYKCHVFIRSADEGSSGIQKRCKNVALHGWTICEYHKEQLVLDAPADSPVSVYSLVSSNVT